MRRRLSLFVVRLWERGAQGFFEKVIFYFLCFLEIFYRLGFSLVIFFKKRRSVGVKTPVISVGNLSVGGTGKSLFILFLAKHLRGRGAVLLRGYGAGARGESDEAMMFREKTNCRVVVGKNRACSAKRLGDSCDYILLDDAYQHFSLKKDFEILLLDARAPLGNGHCLPAGPLREKDFCRADVIVLTHADEIASGDLERLKKSLHFDQNKIFSGRHAVCCKNLPQGPVFAVAGIGSFSGFLSSLRRAGLAVKGHIRYPDHFVYTSEDVDEIAAQADALGCEKIVTTSKDWQKLKKLVGGAKDRFFVLEVEFEFLTKSQEAKHFWVLTMGNIF